MLEDITEAETEMPRCCSVFIQSERVRRRSPRAHGARLLDSAAQQQQLLRQRRLAGVGRAMMAKVRRRSAWVKAGRAARRSWRRGRFMAQGD
jgi:hypothetical protein